MNRLIAVKDANILIDCAQVGLLEAVFQLSYAFHSTDLILAEITDPTQQQHIRGYVHQGKLHIHSLGMNELDNIQALNAVYTGLSLQDCSALFLAQENGAILLTGDRKLRKIARKRKLAVCGILWLLETVHQESLIGQQQAWEKAQALKTSNLRLPRKELDQMIRRWDPKGNR